MIKKVLTITGVLIMLLAFPLMPEGYPWYYEVVLFDVGLVLFLFSQWEKLKNEMNIFKN